MEFLGIFFVFSGRVEEQFSKLLLNGGKAASSPKGHATDAIGKVGWIACNNILFSPVFTSFLHYNLNLTLKFKEPFFQ